MDVGGACLGKGNNERVLMGWMVVVRAFRKCKWHIHAMCTVPVESQLIDFMAARERPESQVVSWIAHIGLFFVCDGKIPDY